MLMKRDVYDKYTSLIDRKTLKESHREISFLFTTLDALHDVTQQDISCDELEAFFWTKFPDGSHDIYDGLFTDLRAVVVSDVVAEAVFSEMQRKEASIRTSELAYEYSQGRASLEDLNASMAVLNAPVSEEGFEFEYVDMNLDSLVAKVIDQPGLRWRLDCLNKSMGSLRKGNFGFLFARPETGKTTFLASEVSYMLDQTDRPVLWLNNEEVDESVALRVYQAYFGITIDQLKANVKQYKKLFAERVGKKFMLVPSVNLDRARIERIVHATQPSLIIYDQIDKVKGFAADRDDLVYGAIYQWARELAKTYAPSIGVCQAGGTGENKKWLDMGDVANAKTSKQAEADWIVGIGKVQEEASEALRYFSICKNKLLGDGDSVSSLRHGRFEVLIQAEQARYKDIIEYT